MTEYIRLSHKYRLSVPNKGQDPYTSRWAIMQNDELCTTTIISIDVLRLKGWSLYNNIYNTIADLSIGRQCEAAMKTKAGRDRVTDELGCGIKLFSTRIVRTMYKHLIGPIEYHVKKLGYTRGNRLQLKRCHQIYRCRTLLDQLVADDIYHLAPIVLQAGKNPHDLKKELGKSTWKQLANNSFWRNKLIALIYDRVYLLLTYSEIQSLKSTMLIYALRTRIIDRTLRAQRLLEQTNTPMKHYTRYPAARGLINNALDIPDIARSLGIPDPTSKCKTMLQLHMIHDELTDQLRAKELAEISQDEIHPRIYIESDDYHIINLNTAYVLHNEGQDMHHCVGSYTNLIMSGKYYIFAIHDKATGERSTLAYNRRTKSISSHLGKYNKPGVNKAVEGIIDLHLWYQYRPPSQLVEYNEVPLVGI